MWQGSDDYLKLYPELVQFVLVSLHDESERILPEDILKETFGEARWMSICTGNDKEFRAYPYNY